jgi:AcrR family transcriptional regulator
MALTTQQHTALEKAFLAQGYESITMSYIAEAIGFTRRALYHHYSSKNEAFRDSVVFQNERGLEAGRAAAAQALANGANAIGVIHALLDARFGDTRRVVARSPHAQKLADAVFRLCGDVINTMAARLQKEIEDILEELQQRRKLTLHPGITSSRLAYMLAASVRGVNQSRPLPKENEFSLRYREMIAALLRGCAKLTPE